MKKILLLFLLLFLLLIPSLSFPEPIQLQWEYPNDIEFDGFKIFMRRFYIEEFNYDSPIAVVGADKRTYDIDVQAGIDANRTYAFVVRAYKGDNESIDSNQANYLVVGIKPVAPINLSGQFDYDTSKIRLQWEQPKDEYDIYQWIVYYRLENESDFIELGKVDEDQDLTLTRPFDIVRDDETKKVFFTVISFRRDYTVHSADSNEFSLVIDRTGQVIDPIIMVLPPENLKISIEIPVRKSF